MSFSKILEDLGVVIPDEDGTCCDFCGETSNPEDNRILLCEGMIGDDYCPNCIHVNCEGIDDEPSEWKCNTCEMNIPIKERSCSLCPRRQGILCDYGGTLVHACCALHHGFQMSAMRDTLSEQDKADVNMNEFSCNLCGLSEGSVVCCTAPECLERFHVTCGRLLGAFVRAPDPYMPVTYCHQHTYLAWELECVKEYSDWWQMGPGDTITEQLGMYRHRLFGLSAAKKTLLTELAVYPESEWAKRLLYGLKVFSQICARRMAEILAVFKTNPKASPLKPLYHWPTYAEITRLINETCKQQKHP